MELDILARSVDAEGGALAGALETAQGVEELLAVGGIGKRAARCWPGARRAAPRGAPLIPAARHSEHGPVDLSAREHGAGGGEGVGLDEKVLSQRVDVTEPALEWILGID